MSDEIREIGSPALTRLVEAAQASAGPGELAGEEAAVAAFRAARAERAPRRVRAVTVRALAVGGVVAVLGGGAGLAAASGHLPAPGGAPARTHPATRTDAPDRERGGTGPAGRPVVPHPDASPAPRPTPDASATPTPSPGKGHAPFEAVPSDAPRTPVPGRGVTEHPPKRPVKHPKTSHTPAGNGNAPHGGEE
ncbi:hypothetical protein BTM25_42870 [Actinomadura rubteroloni]|uniref:Uncharacterized protein n=1 Tax=Actinomadura rubteroloni TaxID=1926885 RepID=A0A2P4UDL5_9ACTN|nr:hypothetical protein [Actinomadura rubteroloni]POM23135.1 hypothetical protein BTM25_42870 [Actinomadura rubteroloni]